MSKPDYDIVADVKKRLNEPFDKYGENARAASEKGELELVNEIILEPYTGRVFETQKGQVVRYELIEGPQIIDTFYMVKDRPMDEWADSFNTASFCGHT